MPPGELPLKEDHLGLKLVDDVLEPIPALGRDHDGDRAAPLRDQHGIVAE